jgi:hypothetical protein
LCYATCSPEERKQHRFKERQILHHAVEWFPEAKVIGDRTLLGRSTVCDPTRYRIDIQLHFESLGLHLHVEVDENEHSTYTPALRR